MLATASIFEKKPNSSQKNLFSSKNLPIYPKIYFFIQKNSVSIQKISFFIQENSVSIRKNLFFSVQKNSIFIQKNIFYIKNWIHSAINIFSIQKNRFHSKKLNFPFKIQQNPNKHGSILEKLKHISTDLYISINFNQFQSNSINFRQNLINFILNMHKFWKFTPFYIRNSPD